MMQHDQRKHPWLWVLAVGGMLLLGRPALAQVPLPSPLVPLAKFSITGKASGSETNQTSAADYTVKFSLAPGHVLDPTAVALRLRIEPDAQRGGRQASAVLHHVYGRHPWGGEHADQQQRPEVARSLAVSEASGGAQDARGHAGGSPDQASAATYDALTDYFEDCDAVTGPQAGASMPTAIANARSSAAILSGGNVARKSVKADLGILISSSQ
jgi:hypothetical protein